MKPLHLFLTILCTFALASDSRAEPTAAELQSARQFADETFTKLGREAAEKRFQGKTVRLTTAELATEAKKDLDTFMDTTEPDKALLDATAALPDNEFADVMLKSYLTGYSTAYEAKLKETK